MKAIRDTGNELVVAMDPHDSVGIIDSYSPGARFFTEIERFDRHLEKLRRRNYGSKVDWISICSPNYLHDAHIRLALRLQANPICEKPLVINPWNLDQLRDLEEEFGKKIYTILQLRLHPAVTALRERALKSGDRHDVVLTYVTRRGAWYDVSWKGSEEKSGGVVMNIGVHFLDMLIWLFGAPESSIVHLREPRKASGCLELPRARVRWFLSLDESDLPETSRAKGSHAYRALTINGEEVDFSSGFEDLHTRVYQEALEGRGFGIDEARASIKAVYDIRSAPVSGSTENAHPMMKGNRIRREEINYEKR